VAELSLTIDQVVHVIDCGRVKEMTYDAVSELVVIWCASYAVLRDAWVVL
jgi:HrpA-like RNA helicase